MVVLCAGRVFEFVHGDSNKPIVTQRNVSEIVTALIASLEKDEPHIAEKVCYAFSQLAAGCRQDDGLSLLSPTFKDIISALLATVCPSACPTLAASSIYKARTTCSS